MAITAPPASLDDAVLSHYRLVAPVMEANFGNIPIVWTTYSRRDPHAVATWHQQCFGHYSHLSAEHLQHLVSIGAQEFFSWFPIAEDPERCRFLRFLLEAPNVPKSMLVEAAHALRQELLSDGRESLPLLASGDGITLWVPVADGPDYTQARTYCHLIAARLIAKHPNLVSLAPNTHVDGCVHLHVSSNAVGRCSIMPYSIHHQGRHVAMPLEWDEVSEQNLHTPSIENFAARFAERGDLFGAQVAAIKALPLPAEPKESSIMAAGAGSSRNAKGDDIRAVIAVLSDGVPRTIQELQKEIAARKLIKAPSLNSLAAALISFIERLESKGRKPPIIQDFDKRYRLNQPPDNWPLQPWTEPTLSDEMQKVVDRLRATSKGDQPTAFEQAVCDALAALNFSAVHVGGKKAPDGYIDAPLGTLGYRVMIECKSGDADHPNIWEAAKFKDQYGAQYCMLVAPFVGDERFIREESQTHGVSTWSLGDLITALTYEFTPLELEACFAPGVAAYDVLTDLKWSRRHGQVKDLKIMAQIIQSSGWVTQRAALEAGSSKDAPLLTEDAAMLLVDQYLAAQNCKASCTREQVRLAFEYLTNPLVGVAVWTDATKTAIVVVSPPQ